MAERRSREQSTAQSVCLEPVNSPLMTFCGWSAFEGCGIVQPRRSSALRTSDGKFENALGLSA
jgi:hypothetical protein